MRFPYSEYHFRRNWLAGNFSFTCNRVGEKVKYNKDVRSHRSYLFIDSIKLVTSMSGLSTRKDDMAHSLIKHNLFKQ